jgi:hypothetical protein
LRKLALSLLLCTFVFLAQHASAQATRTWISGVGDDANPCSRTAPCKTWAGAISKTSAFGEIDALDPGGFGTVTITKSITIDGGPNAGGISAAGVSGITINAASTDIITIRNLYMECLGGVSPCANGINVLNAKALHVQHVDIGAFGNGINISSATTLYADEVTIHDGTGNAINFAPSTTSYASVTNSLFEHNANGVVANDFAKMTVSNSTAAGNSGSGFVVMANAAAATLNLISCNASFNTVAGFTAGGPGSATATLRLSDTAAMSNGVAVASTGTTSVLSFKNNPLTGAFGPLGALSLQ